MCAVLSQGNYTTRGKNASADAAATGEPPRRREANVRVPITDAMMKFEQGTKKSWRAYPFLFMNTHKENELYTTIGDATVKIPLWWRLLAKCRQSPRSALAKKVSQTYGEKGCNFRFE